MQEGIFIDFQKAFDTVNHHILLQKLDHYGIRGRALSLLSNYLVNRKQYVYDSSDVFSQLRVLTCTLVFKCARVYIEQQHIF